MKLKFQSDHLSITRFEDIDLPDLTVLTGVNGSGKSHLLEAIEMRKAVIEGMENARVVRFNFETFKLENETLYNGQQISQERDAAWGYFEQNIKQNSVNWRGHIGNTYDELLKSVKSSKKSFWDLGESGGPVAQYRQQANNFYNLNHVKGNQQALSVLSVIQKAPCATDEISKDLFDNLFKPYSYKNDFLPMALGKIIWDYYIKYSENQIHEFENEKRGKNLPVLTEEQFVAKHGEKPWDVIKEILEKFDSLEYSINSPEGESYFGSYQLKLVHKTKNNLRIDFGSLSSGERVLMALVASIYKTSSDNRFPDILLLDELDASLHPSMMKNMLGVIRDVFLSRGVKVILVTHSPTTVALSDDESIFIMNKAGSKRIEKASRKDALRILTEGFATLDEGMMIFDEVASKKISIITEGHNAKIISAYCEVHGVNDVEVVSGVENLSGKSQLRTLFEFFSKVPHKNKVIFVWDPDVSFSLSEENNTYPFIFEKNQNNNLTKSGIENVFPESLFDGFIKTIRNSSGVEKREFDDSRKKDFAEFIFSRKNKEDFRNFSGLIDLINRLCAE